MCFFRIQNLIQFVLSQQGTVALGAAEGDEDLALTAYVSASSGLWLIVMIISILVNHLDIVFVKSKASDQKIYNMVGVVGEKGTETSLWHLRGILGDVTFELQMFIPDSLNRRIVSIELSSPTPSSSPSSQTSVTPSPLLVVSF
jgi:hypothetical protein